MRDSIFRVGRFLTVMTTLLALIGMATSAQAASFRRGWDPLFNTTFSSTLGWRGEAVIFVSDACISAGATVDFSLSPSCGTAHLESYELEFYNDLTDVILYSVFDSAPGVPLFPAIDQVRFDSGSIANGVSLLGSINVPGPFSFESYTQSYEAFLSFGLDETFLALLGDCFDCSDPYLVASQYQPTVTEWSRVPVPAPLALLGIGVFALVMSRRRKV